MPFHTGLESLQNQLGTLFEKVKTLVKEKPLQAGGIALGAATIISAPLLIHGRKKRRAKKSRRRKAKKARGRKVRRGKHLHKVSRRGKARRHTHRGTKQIHFTKTGQPYILLSSGKARFIKRSSVRRRRKLKGGTY